MEEVPDLYTIDVKLDPDFTKKQSRRCTDPFLNVLCEDGLDGTELDDEELGSSGEDDSDKADESGEDDELGEEGDTVGENQEEEEAETGGSEYPIHNPKVKWNKMRPICGERYENPHQLKLCLTNHAISSGYKIRFRKCDSVRLVAVCASEGKKNKKTSCPYIVRASWMSTERSFQIKKMIESHKCVRDYNSGVLMNPTWIAKQFLKKLVRKPNLKCKEMQTIIQSKYHSKVSWPKCYRARCRAMSLIEGKLSDHYARVWDYAGELLRSNPGSTVKVCVTGNGEETPVFHRIYICFKAIKDGWNKGCRRVIGLDGSFLKGQCKGELLTAIGRDANNQVYPIAWAVVDIENKANWKWFLELVDADLGLQGGRGTCVISDQHKGLLQATKEILPHVEHRQCARHIYANFRKVYSGKEYENMFWAAASSTVEGDFLMHMERIKAVSPQAYGHLMARNPSSWCRAYLGTGLACEANENGVAECFNAIIVHARKRPLLTMLEEIRLYLMERSYNLKKAGEKWEGEVCPAIIEKMDIFAEHIKTWNVVPSGVGAYEARNGFESFAVDLNTRYCACRLWDISGIPCVHAQACILFSQHDPAKFISSWFIRKNYLATFESNINPVNGSKLWVQSPNPKPLPPVDRRMPGRPSIKRKRHFSEHADKHSQVSSKGRTVQCRNCWQRGHNKKTCKNPKATPPPKPKKKMGRPKLDEELTNWEGRGGVRGGRGPRGGRGGGSRSGTRGGRGRGRGRVTQDFVPHEDEYMDDVLFKAEDGTQDFVPPEGADDTIDASTRLILQQEIMDLRESDYSDAEIMASMGITEAEFNDFIAFKDVPVEIDLTQGVGPPDEDLSQISEQDLPVQVDAVPDMEGGPDGHSGGTAVSEDETQVTLKRRKPSERIIQRNLKRLVVDKDGIGMSADKAMELD